MNELKEITIGMVLIALFMLACSLQEQSFFMSGIQKRNTVVAGVLNPQNP